MTVTGKVVGVGFGDGYEFLEVVVRVRVDKGIRRGAVADFKLYLPPSDAKAYWVGRKVRITVRPATR